MFNLIAIPFGWLMRMIYNCVHSYGISIILFTIVIKLLTLPSTYKTQLNQARMALVAPKVAKLKKSFPNNPQRVQEEQNKLYVEEGINQTSGCLGSFLMMFLLLGVYQVVLRPLTFILQMDAGTIQTAKDLLAKWLESTNAMDPSKIDRFIAARPELLLLKYAKSSPEIFSSMSGFTEKLSGFQNNFLGFDLTGTPSLKPEEGWGFTAVMLVLLPAISCAVQVISMIITQAHSRKANPEMAQQMSGMNAMLYLTPLLTLWIGMQVPAGLSFYWLINGIVTLLMTVLLYKYLSGERLIKINAVEKEKQLKKGPTWMQRMMEQSAQMAAEQNGNVRSDANRTHYADGDDGMSRKERAEYERKLIDAARRRAALKYGEELPDENQDS